MSLLERTATMQDLINDVDTLFSTSSKTPRSTSASFSSISSSLYPPTNSMKKESISLSSTVLSLIYDFVTGTSRVETSNNNNNEKTITFTESIKYAPTLISPAKPNVCTTPIEIISTTSTAKDDDCPSLSSSLSSSYSSSSNNTDEGLAASLSDMLISSSSSSETSLVTTTSDDANNNNNNNNSNREAAASSSSSSKINLGVNMVLSNSVFSEEHNWDEMQKEWDQAQEKQVPPPETVPRPGREIRANAAHLRMIAAELNMMRANKIVCPLRPRYHLPRRSDQFVSTKPSPLRDMAIAA